MREDLIVPAESSEKEALAIGSRVIVEPFSPLLVRMRSEKPELVAGLEALRDLVGEEHFEKYFNSLQSLKKDEKNVMLITDNEMKRTAIERQYIGALQQAFAVQYVRVVCQPAF